MVAPDPDILIYGFGSVVGPDNFAQNQVFKILDSDPNKDEDPHPDPA